MFGIYAKVSVKTSSAPLSSGVKKLVKDSLDKISDDKSIYFEDVKKQFPNIADKIKATFFKNNASKISVKELRTLLSEIPDKDEKFWLSSRDWTMQTQKALSDPQKVIQLNFTPAMVSEIQKHPEAHKFFRAMADKYVGTAHPLGDHTFAWARVYMRPDIWIIEEIQTDYAGYRVDDLETMARNQSKVVEHMTKEELKKVEGFLNKHFKDWEKRFLATIADMARKAGAAKIVIFDEDFKKQQSSGIGKSKATHVYTRLPRDLGFKKEELNLGGRNLPVWVKQSSSAVASVLAKYELVARHQTKISLSSVDRKI